MLAFFCEVEDCEHVALELEHYCEYCGYPACSRCTTPFPCPHLVETEQEVDAQMRKRLKTTECITRVPERLLCMNCSGEYCKDCWLDNAVRMTGYGFQPKEAYRYSKSIQKAALLLYCYNKTRDPRYKIPKGMLQHIISFLR